MVAVLVPWTPGCPHRETAWAWVRRRYELFGWDIIEGRGPDGPWCKSLAVEDALSRTTADLLVIADADCWSDGIGAAVHAVLNGHPWARPHENVHRLTQDATDDLLAGGEPGECDPHPYRGVDGGGIVVIPRATYGEVPIDPRFRGWGGEDVSWATALHVLAGRPYGVSQPLLHLWHPPQDDASPRRGPGGARWMNEPNRILHERYKHARKNRDLMAALVNEAKEARDGERQSGPQPQGCP